MSATEMAGGAGGARALSVLARALDAHCAALAACRRCGLGDQPPVPIVAEARTPRVMLVGQAPGKTEAVDRRPFAGRAGKTLFRWLAQAGISEAAARERIYIGAVTRCYPGPSPSGRGDRVPSPRERALCAGWLERELEIIRPALLIPVGRLAIDRFFDPLPLEQLVGRAHTVAHASGTSLAIPLPHPSGASSWVHERGHRELLDAALRVLGDALATLGVIGEAGAGAPPGHQDGVGRSRPRHHGAAAITEVAPVDAPPGAHARPAARSVA
jgi:uracil-DNA glycosylase